MPPSSPPSPGRQTRKRLATRQRISDIATHLFIERGFDQVTIDEIAGAADVSRMTVFNHFPRKEDLFFDLDQVGRDDLLSALAHKPPGTSAIEALRLFAHTAIAEQRPYVCFFEPGTDHFFATIEGSEALKARTRAIRDELTDTLTVALAQAAHTRLPDGNASLAAALLVSTGTVAFLEAHRVFRQHGDIHRTNSLFLSLIDRGTRGIEAALAGTPYV